jgi:hypothetical protein
MIAYASRTGTKRNLAALFRGQSAAASLRSRDGARRQPDLFAGGVGLAEAA